jgi:hypothetical protein
LMVGGFRRQLVVARSFDMFLLCAISGEFTS